MTGVLLNYDPRAWVRLPEAPPQVTPAERLYRALLGVHEHLTAYGHDMTWAERRGAYLGSCSACDGRVGLGPDDQGNARAVARGGTAGSGDYAECPALPAVQRWLTEKEKYRA